MYKKQTKQNKNKKQTNKQTNAREAPKNFAFYTNIIKFWANFDTFENILGKN